jgi:hypothetical protein
LFFLAFESQQGERPVNENAMVKWRSGSAYHVPLSDLDLSRFGTAGCVPKRVGNSGRAVMKQPSGYARIRALAMLSVP